MPVDILLGLQWGDEGKGKIVDYLADKYDVVARFQGGPNAGHTLIVDGEKIVLHTVPSGILHNKPINIIGNGVVLDPVVFAREIHKLEPVIPDIFDKLIISSRTQLIVPTHRILDAASEAAKGLAKIGSTLKGIGPAYMDKTGRNGLRVGDISRADFDQKFNELKQKHLHILKQYEFEYEIGEKEQAWFECIELLRRFKVTDTEYLLNDVIKKGGRVLAEGAQGSMLDIDFGTYPFVTSSNTLAGGACMGLGIAPRHIKDVIGVIKAYCTRVGSGPFVTELHNETGERIRAAGNEFGSTTGRPRRTGWLDMPALNYVNMLNGTTQLIITKADVLTCVDELKICVAYDMSGEHIEQLTYHVNPENVEPVYHTLPGWTEQDVELCRLGNTHTPVTQYIKYIEKATGVKVSMLSLGPERENLFILD